MYYHQPESTTEESHSAADTEYRGEQPQLNDTNQNGSLGLNLDRTETDKKISTATTEENWRPGKSPVESSAEQRPEQGDQTRTPSLILQQQQPAEYIVISKIRDQPNRKVSCPELSQRPLQPHTWEQDTAPNRCRQI